MQVCRAKLYLKKKQSHHNGSKLKNTRILTLTLAVLLQTWIDFNQKSLPESLQQNLGNHQDELITFFRTT